MVDGGHPAQSNIFFAIKFWPISSQDERGSILLFLFLYSRTSLPPLGHQKYHGVCSENSFLARNLYIKLPGALSLNTLVLRHFKAEIPRDLFILVKSIQSIMFLFIIPNRIRVACKPTQMYGFRSRFSFGREPNHQRPRIQQNTQLDGVEGGQKMAMVCLLFPPVQ